MIQRSLILILFIGVSPWIYGQHSPPDTWCGTRDGKVAWLEEYQKDPQSFPRSSDTLWVPMTLHLVGTTESHGFFPMPDLLDAFCVLNQDFRPTGIQFYIEFPIRYISNTNYYNHDFNSGAEMMDANNVVNTINCYVSESPAPNVCGYSDYGRGIALAKNCTDNGSHTWAHEVGHYLSLPHTFFGWEGIEHDYSQPAPEEVNYGRLAERVDSLDCELASDGFCDTPPDYLNYRWFCDDNGESTVFQSDPSGAVFQSQARYFMSYSSDVCMSIFSEQQIEAMRANMQTEKIDMLYDQTPTMEILGAETFPIFPPEGDTIPFYVEVLLSWEPVSGATHYIIEMSTNSNFTGPVFRQNVEGSSFLRKGGIKNQTYFWRVRPYNRAYSCKWVSEVFSYTTGDQKLTSQVAGSLPGLREWIVYPNPVVSGQDWHMMIHADEVWDVEFRLYNQDGKNVSTNSVLLSTEPSTVTLPSMDLTPGWYLIQMVTRKGVETRKLIISGQ